VDSRQQLLIWIGKQTALAKFALSLECPEAFLQTGDLESMNLSIRQGVTVTKSNCFQFQCIPFK